MPELKDAHCCLMLGLSEAESEKEPASLPFVERHDLNTPTVTPSRSPAPSVGTPSLSVEEFIPPPPSLLVTQPTAAVVAPSPIADVRDASVECQL